MLHALCNCFVNEPLNRVRHVDEFHSLHELDRTKLKEKFSKHLIREAAGNYRCAVKINADSIVFADIYYI